LRGTHSTADLMKDEDGWSCWGYSDKEWPLCFSPFRLETNSDTQLSLPPLSCRSPRIVQPADNTDILTCLSFQDWAASRKVNNGLTFHLLIHNSFHLLRNRIPEPLKKIVAKKFRELWRKWFQEGQHERDDKQLKIIKHLTELKKNLNSEYS
jgi:hypothetical protein